MEAELEKKISSLLEDQLLGHSPLQMDAFITAKSGEGHPYGMYLQALRELAARRISLMELESRVKETWVELRSLSCRKWWDWAFPISREKRKILERRKLFELDQACESRRNTERELFHFLDQATKLKGIVGKITFERRRELDLELWAHKLKFRLACDYFREGRPSLSLIELVPFLPEPMKVEMLGYLKNNTELLEWYRSIKGNLFESPQESKKLESQNGVSSELSHVSRH